MQSTDFTPNLHADFVLATLGRPMAPAETKANHDESRGPGPGATAEAFGGRPPEAARGRRRRPSREERKKRRAERVRGRKKIIGIANEVYEEGDTRQDLREKITAVLEDGDAGGDRPFLDFLLALLEQLLPILIEAFLGGMTGGLI